KLLLQGLSEALGLLERWRVIGRTCQQAHCSAPAERGTQALGLNTTHGVAVRSELEDQSFSGDEARETAHRHSATGGLVDRRFHERTVTVADQQEVDRPAGKLADLPRQAIGGVSTTNL